MKQEDTKQRILEKSLELFASKGYDAVSVGEIAKAVGVKAPSLYNHFASKQAIFDAIVESTAAHYEKDTGEISIHVQDVKQDFALFAHISEDALVEKVHQIFFYSLHDHTVSQFRQMMTLEQFRSPELAELYSRRYVDRMIDYHADIFRTLISLGILRAEDPDTLALQYVSPVITLLSVCDRQPEREAECLEKLGEKMDYLHLCNNDGVTEVHTPLDDPNGVLPLKDFFRVIKRYGYNGWASIELLAPYFREPEMYLAGSIKYLESILDEVGIARG